MVNLLLELFGFTCKVALFAGIVWLNLWAGHIHASFWTVFGLVGALQSMLFWESRDHKAHLVAQLVVIHDSLLNQLKREIGKIGK